MTRYEQAIKRTGERGVVERLRSSVAWVRGLPGARPGEMVIAQTGEIGQVVSLSEAHAQVLLFSNSLVQLGMGMARAGHLIEVSVGTGWLGQTVDPLGHVFLGERQAAGNKERVEIDTPPPPMMSRRPVGEQFITGSMLIDLVIPLARGQRELVIGNRKLSKSQFLQRVMLSHVRRGGVCVYATIAKPQNDISGFERWLEVQKIKDRVATVATNAASSSGLIFLTPYTAMTEAEYLRDEGENVLLIMDDLSIHAKYYREVSLLLERFPGRSSYPGDVFFAHARLMERAGVVEKGSITCLPVAETTRGNMSEYIATNLMSMTDGHIYFDADYHNQGRRPAINPYLSVTRVGHQAQSGLYTSISTDLSSFLIHFRQMEQLSHFGGELNAEIHQSLKIGGLLMKLFYDYSEIDFPLAVGAVLVAMVWAGVLDEVEEDLSRVVTELVQRYIDSSDFRGQVDALVEGCRTFPELRDKVKEKQGLFSLEPVRTPTVSEGGVIRGNT